MIFPHDQLRSLTQRIFAAAGCNPEESERVATLLVEANLVGHDSHGVLRIPSYVQWLRAGKVIANQTINVLVDDGPLAVVDGQFGLGQSVGHQSMQLGIEKATQHGVAVVALRNAGHLGRIGDWPLMAARAGFISLHFVNTSGAGMLVAPHGGIERRLSVDPIAASVPVPNGAPLLLDMSAATIAEGKVRVALNKGETVPEGCLIDAVGNPTCEPSVFYGNPPGSILPIAGHKGFGLSMIIEMLAGALTGGSCTNPKHAEQVANGMLSIILDPSRFLPTAEFNPEVSRFVDFVKSSRTTTPTGEVLMPGEPEQRTKAQRLIHGIELDATTCSQIATTCGLLEIDPGFEPPQTEQPSQSQAEINIPGVDSEE
ncbi:MAG: malate/lactate/ureidoglycolate dehydrogenase [Pirellulaceae bacterium]|nr:malate/lactate/ureidoglycolate dehydrogenase [Pirellulaceae bacterium]